MGLEHAEHFQFQSSCRTGMTLFNNPIVQSLTSPAVIGLPQQSSELRLSRRVRISAHNWIESQHAVSWTELICLVR